MTNQCIRRTCISLVLWFGMGLTALAEPVQRSFQQRLYELDLRIGEVDAEVAKSDGYLREAGRVDVEVARMFAGYIRWELANPDFTKNALDADRRYQKRSFTSEDTEARYRAHIDYELRSSMRILDNAMARMKEDKDWPETRKIDWSDMRYVDERFRSRGEVVYPAGFNMLQRKFIDLEKFPDWEEKDEALRREFLLRMNTLGVSIVAGGINATRLIKADGSIDEVQVDKVVRHHVREGTFGSKVSVLMHWGGDRDVLGALYPGIMDVRANGVYMDIDHPGVPELVSKTMAGLMPELKQADILAWDMANEPFFDMEDWSLHSLSKYRIWLEEQYGEINSLNALWQTKYKAFEGIPLPAERPLEECTPAERFDRVTFHNKRVTDFFGLIAGEVRRHIPDAPIHVKVQDNNSLGPRPFSVIDGMDREGMTPYVNMHGLDTRPLAVTEPRMAAEGYDGSLYAFHWLGQSFTYDYLGSLQPKRPIVDFEYHSMSINPIRVPQIPEDHSRATLWLAHLHGLIGNKMWYWQRRYGPGDPFPAEYFRLWFYGSVPTQPLMAAEYFHTMRELNTHAPKVDALASIKERPVRILVSNSSYIQNPAHIAALHRVYEGLCFHGLPIGFITEKTLRNSGVPKDCSLLIIPEVTHLHEDALAALGKAAGRTRMLGYGNQVIRYDTHGVFHPEEDVEALNAISRIAPADAASLSESFVEILSEQTGKLAVQVSASGQDHAFGVMQRQVFHEGKIILILVNVAAEPLQLELKDRTGKVLKAFDLLNREAIDGKQVMMPLRKVRLLEIIPF